MKNNPNGKKAIHKMQQYTAWKNTWNRIALEQEKKTVQNSMSATIPESYMYGKKKNVSCLSLQDGIYFLKNTFLFFCYQKSSRV